MEEDSKKREALRPQLLDLIPDEREWKLREAQDVGRSRNTGLGGDDDKKLELKLGLPGRIQGEAAPTSRVNRGHNESPSLSLGCFPNITTITTGAKRGFLDTVDAKTEGYSEQKQQARAGCGKELAAVEKTAAAGERKKGCCPPPPPPLHAPPPAAATACTSVNRPRGAAVPVVGWPPIRSFRRNLASSSSSKQSPEPQNGEADATKAKLKCIKRPLVKINMDGIPIGRKVDLAAYDSYERLSLVVKELFHGFLQARNNISSAGSEHGADEKIFSQLLNGSGEYILVYEDNEGDRMLVGDVPWEVFVSTAKRLRVLRRSELSHVLIRAAPRRLADC